MDWSQLLGNANTPGLLSPEQQGNVNSNAIESMAVALLKAAGPSQFKAKMTTLSGLGEGLQAGLTGRQAATDEALKQTCLGGQIKQQQNSQTLAAVQLAATYRGLGLPVPPQVQRILDAASGGAGTAGGGVAQTLQVPTQPGQPGAFSPTSGTPPWPQAPATAGAISPAGATNPAPAPQNAPPAALRSPSGVMGAVQSLPLQDRYALIAGGPAGDIVKAAAAKNLERTEAEKNASASGRSDPLDYERQLKLSPEERAAATYGMPLPIYQAFAEGAKSIGAAHGKQMGEAIEAGGHAQKTLITLNNMEDALANAPDNIATGPLSKEWLKIKQFASNLGFDSKGVNESEVVDKLNAFLAGEATKQISSRPAQFEFQTYLKNSPGLMTSLEGTRKLISIMRQGAEQDIGLGKLAGNENNLRKWSDVQDQYFREHPITSPFTGKPVDRDRPAVPPPLAQTATPTPTAKGAPPVGYVDGRHRFTGGNPNDRANWETLGATMPIVGVR